MTSKDPNKLEITLITVRESFLEEKESLGFQFIFAKGQVWEFHKYDVDPWPSTPHGHSKEKPQKINVYAGEIYHSKTKKYIGKLKTK